MKKLHYNRLEYVPISQISKVALKTLAKKTGKDITDIKELAYYKFGAYSKQPLVVFFNDGSIYKISASLKITRIK